MHKNNNRHKEKDHDHDHGGIFGKNTELYFAVLSGFFFFTGLFFNLVTDLPYNYALYSFMAAYFFGGYFTVIEAVEKIRKGEFEIDFLMIVAAAGAAYIGSWQEGALLLFLFSLGHSLEHFAMNKAKRSIEALADLSPKTALIKKGNDVEEIMIEDLKIGDTIVIRPNSKISADGVIVKGSSTIDQSSITGESMPVTKTAIKNINNLPDFREIDKVHIVYTGTLNGDRSIEVRVLKLYQDSTISRLIKMVSEVETQKSPTQRLTKKFEKWFVPAVIVLVVALCFAYLIIDEMPKESLYRAISVLVAASPCALAISTPSAVLSGVARAARGGVLIKGGRALEDLGSLTTIAFDKTGTLTEGKPKLTHAIPLNNFEEKKFYQMILDVESLSNHPLAKAISKGLKEQFSLEETNRATETESVQGKGIRAVYDKGEVLIGNELLNNGQTAMLAAYKNELAGILSVMDTPRETAKTTLARLKKIGIKKMIMLTGDHQIIADSIAREIGLTEAKGNLLPEDKVKAIEELKERDSKIAMVGDGVNDAPAMAKSTVGIAMGAAGSDVALETADVALMSDKIEKLPFVIGLSRESKKIIKQNLWISMGVVAFLIPVTILGMASIGVAVAMHEGSTLVVVINALRLLRYSDDQ